jgi:hypothetical protein
MRANPIPAEVPHSRSDRLLRRMLGAMSLFTMFMTIPQVDHLDRASGRRGFTAIVECLSRLCRSLALVWDSQTRQEHLFGLSGMDRTR